MSNEPSPVRVAIIGAGIGGLTLALGLKGAPNVKVDVYEGAKEISEIGGGIGLWPRTWEILGDLGVQDDVNAMLEEPYDITKPRHGSRFVRADQKEVKVIGDFWMPGGNMTLHRVKVQQMLLKGLDPSCTIHTSKRLSNYTTTPSGSIRLTFTDGSQVECDVLIGADGLRSAVRRIMSEEKPEVPANPIWTGTSCYRYFVSVEQLRNRMPTNAALQSNVVIHFGRKRHLVTLTLNQGNLLYVLVYVTDTSREGTSLDEPMVSEASRDEILDKFDGWSEDAQVLIQMSEEKVSRWHLHAVTPLPTYISGNVALMGDAAHAMTPNLGSGAGQAMEDAYVLAAIMSSPSFNRRNIDECLKIYDEVRRPLGNFVLKAARAQGFYYDLNVEGLEELNDDEKHQKLFKLVEQNRRWGSEIGSPGEARKRALGMMKERL